jgi:hypothetical protein
VAPPPWLKKALVFKSDEGKELMEGKYMLFNFGVDEGGWCVAKIEKQMCDPKQTVEVVDDDHPEITMYVPYNFRASYYEEDDAENRSNIELYLDMDEYATSANAEPGSWCILGKVSGKRKGKAPMTAAEQAAAKVAKMTPEERTDMLAALQDAQNGGRKRK